MKKKITNLLAWNRIEEIYEDNPRILRTVRGGLRKTMRFFSAAYVQQRRSYRTLLWILQRRGTK